MSQAKEIQIQNPRVCPYKYAFMLDNWVRKMLQNPKRIVGEYIQAGNTVIDLGCGPGFFSVQMAKMVGDKGHVIAVDLQEEMLAAVHKKAVREHVSQRMAFHRCGADSIGLKTGADFILAFYMLHETPDPRACLVELKDLLSADGRILIVEPRMHVSKKAFQAMLQDAEAVGLRIVELPRNKGGRSVLLALSLPAPND
jgi:ubiquinone/menaquinone biosynthesis C-methylase UbiE